MRAGALEPVAHGAGWRISEKEIDRTARRLLFKNQCSVASHTHRLAASAIQRERPRPHAALLSKETQGSGYDAGPATLETAYEPNQGNTRSGASSLGIVRTLGTPRAAESRDADVTEPTPRHLLRRVAHHTEYSGRWITGLPWNSPREHSVHSWSMCARTGRLRYIRSSL